MPLGPWVVVGETTEWRFTDNVGMGSYAYRAFAANSEGSESGGSPPAFFDRVKEVGKRSDFTGDGHVGFADYAEFAQHFGQVGTGRHAGYDLDGDGKVGISDFMLFADNFGKRVELASGDITTELPGGSPMEFVWIRPGSFMMGSSHLEPGRGSYEGPKHRVEISSGFHLGRHEVTQAQWERVMGSRPWEGRDRVREGPDYPAVFVSWNDVEDFVARLNAGEQEPVYRLPTEAEWEYAA
ncbi:MAG: SUMF1/EgtB/PvdO family nonheme iron enzyme, partial [Candidatus Latescibacteria bacterium]|nr:SUMF1/EgtB/PvdO family nonheme iron enzyme [Candidatus Latescibacterota bacterium]